MLHQKISERASQLFRELEGPESIRTPGRTWTRFPKVELEETESYTPEISENGDVEVFTGEEAVEEAGDKLMDAVKLEENWLTALHAASMNSIVFVKASGSSKVNVTYKNDGRLHSHIVAVLEEGAELSLVEEFRGSSDVDTSIDEFYVGKNANLEYGAIESSDTEVRYSVRKAILDRDSHINWLNGIFNGKLSKTRVETVLKGDNSSTEKTGVWYPIEDQHFDISLKTYHIGEYTKCDMDSRAVVDDTSRSLYEGLQKVKESAENTKSFQDQETLLLSDKAEADASPKLMIENPEVEASHAAAAGNIQEEKRHYLESRGLSEKAAERLVVKGYFEPVMENIDNLGLKEKIREEVQKKIEH